MIECWIHWFIYCSSQEDSLGKFVKSGLISGLLGSCRRGIMIEVQWEDEPSEEEFRGNEMMEDEFQKDKLMENEFREDELMEDEPRKDEPRKDKLAEDEQYNDEP
ncbi:hypothetical protein L873DRAFT_1796068 [Choiromyces venosus 120613-1]|uniref:Uncharacterized protein n=1 Tax=Choiromyces venosus 120613-1 TaxID=1336337 RepID=A0A3N4IUN2_9PEZI|nr:hypothetical protein L873DRAFT_1796068 [Choiromyces venosus 120613-1]